MHGELAASQPNAIATAVGWPQSILDGSVATSLAIVGVACFGLMLMTGRLRTRRAAQIVLGCFIIFGAGAIAGGIRDVLAASPSRLNVSAFSAPHEPISVTPPPPATAAP